MEKACTKCLNSFPIEHFHLKGSGRHNSRCPRCCYEWVKANKDMLNAYKKQRYWGNVEKFRKMSAKNQRAYYRRNAEEIKKGARERHAANKQRNNQKSREYYARHKDAILNRSKGWKKGNPDRIKKAGQQYRKNHAEEIRVSNQNR